jgi:hypothetical protein
MVVHKTKHAGSGSAMIACLQPIASTFFDLFICNSDGIIPMFQEQLNCVCFQYAVDKELLLSNELIVVVMCHLWLLLCTCDTQVSACELS